MLDGLDQVDWARLTHAYGAARDVPDQIRELVSPDPARRRTALSKLYGNIYHQGTIYEATAHAVPFLLEVLAAPDYDEQPQLLRLLAAIVTGSDELWLPDGLPVAEHREAAVGGDVLLAAAPRPDDFDEDEDEDDYLDYLDDLTEDDQSRLFAHIWVTAYDAVRAGVPLFRELLTLDPPTQCMAAYALAWFPQEAPESLRALANVTEGDPEGVVAATASIAMGLLGGRPTVTLADERPLARWGAAIALAMADGPDATEDVVDELVAVAAGSIPDNARMPFLGGNLAGYAAAALGQTGDRHAGRTFDALLARIPAVSGSSAFGVVKEALRLAFPARLPAGTGYAALDERQRRLVDTLAASPRTWLIDGRSFGNFSMLVAGYGLPTGSEALRAYTDTR